MSETVLRDSGVMGHQCPARRLSERYDLHDLNAGCDANVWSGNIFGTAFPACAAG